MYSNFFFFLEKLSMYSKLILEIEISVLKANGIKHKEYSLYIHVVFGL